MVLRLPGRFYNRLLFVVPTVHCVLSPSVLAAKLKCESVRCKIDRAT